MRFYTLILFLFTASVLSAQLNQKSVEKKEGTYYYCYHKNGKISTETVWQVVENEISDNGDDSQQALEERIRQELTVVDSAGRLQVPKEYLEKFNIKGRVQLEMAETGILKRPVDQITETKSAEDLVDQMELVTKSNPLVRLRSRLLSGKGEKSCSGKI